MSGSTVTVNGAVYVAVDVPTDYGTVRLPLPQAEAMAVCVDRLQAAGKRATWHEIECGCCLTVHEYAGDDDDHALIAGGYVIGPDGAGRDEWLTLYPGGAA